MANTETEKIIATVKNQTGIAIIALSHMMELLADDKNNILQVNLAKYVKKQFEAFQKEGFSEEQALCLTGATIGHFTRTG